VDTAKQLSDFMCYFNSNLAKEIARRTGWKDKVWSRRYQAIVISDEDEMQMARLRYCLSPRGQGEPGGAGGGVAGRPLRGSADDRVSGGGDLVRPDPGIQRLPARKTLEKGESESRERVYLSPLPCWKHLSEEAYRARIADLVREINESGAAARAESQIAPLGPAGVRAQNPETRPKKIKRSSAPFCHALRKKVRMALWEAYGYFVAAYREAAERLRAGDRTVEFPPGSFPPRLPFVPA
jgi:hypothetical protein